MPLIASALLLSSCTPDDFLNTVTVLPNGSVEERVVLGLKTALSVGIDSSSGLASKLNGYLANQAIKILLPDEAAQALQAVAQVATYVKPFTSQLQAVQSVANLTLGLDASPVTSNLAASTSLISEINALPTLSDSLVKYMNRAAEYAAPRSVPIFKSAITGMSIMDGLSLLNSSDSTAATAYLHGSTFGPLDTAYTPLVDSTLKLVPLTQYWGQFRTTYNNILSQYNSLLAFQTSWNKNSIVASASSLQVHSLQSVTYQPIKTESLGQWTTEKALGGLFFLVGNEETKIRRDPFTYVMNMTSDIANILSDVFGKIMDRSAK